ENGVIDDTRMEEIFQEMQPCSSCFPCINRVGNPCSQMETLARYYEREQNVEMAQYIRSLY
ncbi:1806_t:CDS:1, partial [Funneliformis caledonium]